MHNVVPHMNVYTYWEVTPHAQFCAILLLLLLGPSIIAFGVFNVFPVSAVCMPTTSVNKKFDMYFECIKLRICRHLLSQTHFEILVPVFVRFLQGIEDDSPSILRVD